MDYQAFYRHVRDLFNDRWTATDVIFPNEPAPPFEPVGDQASASYPAAMLLVDFNDETTDFATYGTRRVIDGTVVITICVEAGCGEDKLFDLYDSLATMFEDYGDSSSDEIQFLVPRMGGMVAFEDLPIFGREAHFPFKRFQA